MRIYGGEVQGLTGAELRRGFVAFLWSRQVDAAARVGEDEETRGGGGGARAAAQWREEEEDGGDEWPEAYGPGYL